MSYVSAEKILPKELIEQIQQYVSGKSIYIPSKEKKKWGSETTTKQFYTERNREICTKHINGLSVKALAAEYALSEKSIERIIRTGKMKTYSYIVLAEKPAIKESAAEWFSEKWGIPKEAYLECMESYLKGETVYGWYLCFDGEKIVGGLGVIENDFHDRKDLFPNICAVYTEEAYRKQGIAGNLLRMAVEDLREKGVSPVYLLTDHVGFYERYGWEFLCMANGDGEDEPSRIYMHS